MFLLLMIICLLSKALTSHISLHGNTAAEYGSDVHYKCAMNSTGVQQITWQRLFKDEPLKNLATYSERFGQEVNKPYVGKLIFTEASLSSASIALKNVTWEDESCYICSFNIFPDGSKRSQICLKVQGISKVNTMSHTVSSGRGKEHREVVFSCSATGKPAPTITWDFSAGATPSDQPQTVTVTNSDHTLTTSSNITLKVPSGWSGHVDCLLNGGLVGQRTERIPFSLPEEKEKEKGEEEESGKGLSASGTALIAGAIIVICIAAAVVLRKWLRKKKNGNQSPV